MDETNSSRSVHDAIQGHAPKFEEIHFLFVEPGNDMIRIGQTDERQVFAIPIGFESSSMIGSHRHDLRAARFELIVIIPEARQLRAAERSGKTAQKREEHRLAFENYRKTDRIPIHIIQFEVGSGLARGDQSARHGNSKYSSTIFMNGSGHSSCGT